MPVARRHDDLHLHLHVLGQEHELSARVRVGPTRTPEVLPAARAIADGVTQIALERSREEGRPASCQRGCTSCCRQMVPLAPVEAIRLAEVVEAMPGAKRRAVTRRFEEIVKRMEDEGMLDRAAPRGRTALLSHAGTPLARWEDVSHRYFAMHIDCPFLEDGACIAYQERPMACREYHATTPKELCATLDARLEVAPRPVRMGDALARLSNGALGRDDPQVPLPLALEWARANRRAFERSVDGEALAMALVQELQDADAEGEGGAP